MCALQTGLGQSLESLFWMQNGYALWARHAWDYVAAGGFCKGIHPIALALQHLLAPSQRSNISEAQEGTCGDPDTSLQVAQGPHDM